TKGPAAFFIPNQGVSAIDKEGGPFHDADADEACFESIRSNLGSNVELQDLDQHINDDAFAEVMAKKLIALMKT
ncbi:MAG: Tm-1-like ATP-binding domain-containing protein, partial [Candidatus Omnitrophica bacterium]|nr:Tm-1-like ATP-binding domain-containing protein [Candidatus Omnitrophota bacterium]